ncbi:cation:H+ antiporter [Palleronia marisminoris]|uniref:Inner membrane protein YrbG n=1 Tax=Palleronia marisminoris TaxID=315423 RepID=A0A1Y5TPL7_9RHOB|nr:calcium/sodium antiporter [Palleronia marisminoris]SFH43667.1 cation:H+ antiporter [Palleronia marisminoris]SLN66754.1 Inner membrane protein YrbG [Palleronia marisminoris]
MNFLLAIVGLVILLIAGNALVKGAVNLSLRVGIPAFVVSLTVVAFGTSAPEMLISVDAVLSDVPGIALGNVVGSNTANVLLVLGLPALFYMFDTSQVSVQKSYLVMMAATVLFIVLALVAAPFNWMTGLVLLAVLAVILTDQFREGMRSRVRPEDLEGADANLGWPRILFFLVVGLIGLPIGAHVLIDSAREIAMAMGISEAVIGLTLVALGTSLPELATTLAAARKDQADVALGNVLGSNLFNLLAIIGVAALFGEIPVGPSFLRLDLWVMLGASVVLAPFIFTRLKMGRLVGAGLCLLYAFYMWWVVAP